MEVLEDVILEEKIEENQDSVEVLEDVILEEKIEKNQDMVGMTDVNPESKGMSEEVLQNDNHTDVAGKSFLDCKSAITSWK